MESGGDATMALTNRDRVHKGLDLLMEGLKPFVERQLEAQYGENWRAEAADALRQTREWQPGDGHMDAQALLLLMWFRWNETFGQVLGHAERSLVSELRTVRNKDAHQEIFSTDDAYRALDSIQRLLAAVSAPQAVEVDQQKQDLLRLKFEEQARSQTRRVAANPTEGKPQAGLSPWRELITPHPDVASGRYQQAEFAADLNQVYRGEGVPEYRDPEEFFARTFITDGIRLLLVNALQRLAGTGGDPVVELQTNFGGGKTHSMLALFHLFSGLTASSLPGVEPLLQEAGVEQPAGVRRAVLVGQALSPGQSRLRDDGTEVRTLWGELGWQLLGREGYALVAEADRQGASPGSDVLSELFRKTAPCLVLIDEWVSYLRQLYHVHTMPAGSFDANLTFAQSLTEAARAVPRALLVASLPSSDIEVGGQGGREALDRLRNTFGRMAEPWRPASTEEGFEIVRRRLFQPMDRSAYPARDAAIKAFSDLYRTQAQEFPAPAREGEYERRMKAAYPIHPELFDMLYKEWSSLDKFQRTRGVLRLMAATISVLWEGQDGNLLILPGSVPIEQPAVHNELMHYLEDPWMPVIETDVDGPQSLPLRLDRGNPNLGRYSAARRVARTIYLGSAPTFHTPNKGIDDRQIKLGCVQPGESVATFGDALRRLADGATHLYVDGNRYWFSTQPSVTRLAEDRAAQQDPDTVLQHIEQALKQQQATRGEFARVHSCPTSSADVPDEQEARLVILRPATAHVSKAGDSPARKESETILQSRGASPRTYANMLVFLAADKTRLEELDRAVRSYLAWRSIAEEHEQLNLDAFQKNQALTKRDQAKQTVERRIPETYIWLLVPGQPQPTGPVEWQEIRLQGDEALAVRAGRKLINEEMLIRQLGGTRLRMELDKIPLWRGDDLGIKQLWDDFCRYLYLPRLRDQTVLLGAIQDGVASLTWESDTFAYAESKDEQTGRYRGLRGGNTSTVLLDSRSLLVKPEVARAQMMETAGAGVHSGTATVPAAAELGAGDATDADSGLRVSTPESGIDVGPVVRSERYFGKVELNPLAVASSAAQIAENIVQHLEAVSGARVRLTLEIEAELPEGVPPQVKLTVLENGRTLKFTDQGFEEE
jgi:predicted AAA+ superfamily ATPase